jgi:hypothetical protein
VVDALVQVEQKKEMIQAESRLEADNTGAKSVLCIKVLYS